MIPTGALAELLDPVRAVTPEVRLQPMGLAVLGPEVLVAGAVIIVVAGVVVLMRRRRSPWAKHAEGLPQVIFPVGGGMNPAADLPSDLPAAEPEAPAAAPDAAGASPGAPAAEPEAPTAVPDIPAYAPDVRGPSSDVAASAPDAPAPASEVAAAPADARTAAPDSRTTAPDGSTAAPDAAAAAPDVAGASPDVPAPASEVSAAADARTGGPERPSAEPAPRPTGPAPWPPAAGSAGTDGADPTAAEAASARRAAGASDRSSHDTAGSDDASAAGPVSPARRPVATESSLDPMRPAAAAPGVARPLAAEPEASDVDTPHAEGSAVPALPPEAARFEAPDPVQSDAGASDGAGREWVDAGPVRFERPPQGTLQLLPGRLEIQSGEGRGQEIRFVRAPGSPPEITFGRNTGPEYRHIQLRVPTVSRLHAHLRFENGAWTLRNLSGTNPTIVNGRTLGSGLEEASLQDGDRIEMGEVVFTFRQPEVRDRLPFRSSWHTDRGLRPTNHDAVVIRTLPACRELAAVCDGIGSHEAAGKASWMAIEALVEACQDGQDLASGVRRANEVVWTAAEAAPEREGMGTTLVALLRQEDRYWIANVGDSRAYRIDADGIRQVTRDHSFMAEATEGGGMSAEEAARSPWRKGVTRNLGAATEVEVDVFGEFSAHDAHVLVLCTDGIHDVLDRQDMDHLVRTAPHIRDVARILCEAAIRGKGKDNVAAAALAFGGGLAGRDVETT